MAGLATRATAMVTARGMAMAAAGRGAPRGSSGQREELVKKETSASLEPLCNLAWALPPLARRQGAPSAESRLKMFDVLYLHFPTDLADILEKNWVKLLVS